MEACPGALCALADLIIYHSHQADVIKCFVPCLCALLDPGDQPSSSDALSALPNASELVRVLELCKAAPDLRGAAGLERLLKVLRQALPLEGRTSELATP